MAARRGKRNVRRRQRGQSSLPGWAWLTMGLAIGLAGAAVTFMIVNQPAGDAGAPQDQARPSAPAGPTQAPPASKDAETAGQRFDFYELLPNLEVVVPDDAEQHDQPQIRPRGEALPPGRYALQAGSFRHFKEADRLKAQIALLGISSHIQKVTIDGKETWYRVRIGPIEDRQRLQKTRARLDQEGIETMLLRVSG